MTKPIDRRTFLASGAAGAILSGLKSAAIEPETQQTESGSEKLEFNTTVDFRFAPADFQSAICFPSAREWTAYWEQLISV